MNDTESTDLIYLLESKSIFIFSWEQLPYGNYFLSLFEADFYGDGGWVDEEFLAPGQGSKLINQHLFYWAAILKRWLYASISTSEGEREDLNDMVASLRFISLPPWSHTKIKGLFKWRWGTPDRWGNIWRVTSPIMKTRDFMDRRVTPPKRVTSLIRGPPPPSKQALTGLTGPY